MHPFIVIEGLMASGKTTLAKSLAKRLGGKYCKTPLEPFQSARTLVDRYAPNVARFYFYVSAVYHANLSIRRWLLEGPVVCDKYIHSTLAFHRAMSVPCDDKWINWVIKPDIVLLLDAQRSTRALRLTQRHHQPAQLPDSDFENEVLLRFRAFDLQTLHTDSLSPEQTTDRALRLICGH